MVSNEILLLKSIKNNENILSLKNRGLTYSQIALLLKQQEIKGNIILGFDAVKLTKQGAEYLEKNISKIIVRKKDQWILPNESKYINKISIDKIILPEGR